LAAAVGVDDDVRGWGWGGGGVASRCAHASLASLISSSSAQRLSLVSS
jgi:hypothetical protein